MPPAMCTAPDPTSTSFYDGVSFLFQGDCATQKNVDSAALTRARVAVLRGHVVDDAGKPLAGVAISTPQQPTWGTTTSAADGAYAFAVQGGGKVVLRFELKDHITAQRSTPVGWNRVALLDAVALIAPSAKTSSVDLGGGAGWQVATGEAVLDASGARTLHVLFPPGVKATKVAADGTESALTTGTLRLTEYTRGDHGKNAMPATLPETSAYTYASALTFDEANGAKTVRFDNPVYAYLDNFLKMRVGTTVPVGSYRVEGDSWDAGASGVVVAVVDAGGMLGLDVDGDGQADTGVKLDAFAITQGEIDALGGIAKAGDSLWRAPLAHFTSVDFNWGVVPPPGAGPANGGSPTASTDAEGDCTHSTTIKGASWIECENQTLHDDIALTGTAMGLHYSSARARGRTAAFTLNIPITGDTVPPNVKRAEVDVDVLGAPTHTEYTTVGPRLTNTFAWDGKDAWGRTWLGRTMAHVRISLVYEASTYSETLRFGEVPDGTSASMGATRSEIVFKSDYEVPVGLLDASEVGLGGWTLTGHHAYDPQIQILYRGDGRNRSAASILAFAEAFAGNATAGFSGDNGPAAASQLNTAHGIAVMPDGSVIVSDEANHRIRKIDPAGTISTFAGSGRDGTAGDGGPAIAADLSAPQALAAKADGTVCVSDANTMDPNGTRVRCIDPAGAIRTVLGGGSNEPGANDDIAGTDFGIPAVLSVGLAFAADGRLVFNAGSVFVLGTNGRVSLLAGLATSTGNGDGGNAKGAKFGLLGGVAIALDGSVLVADNLDNRVRRIAPDGTISTFAGTGAPGYAGDGGAATVALLTGPTELAVGPDGSVYIGEWASDRVRRVLPSGVITTFAGGGDTTTFPVAARQVSLPLVAGMASSPDGSLFFSGDSRVLRFRTPLPTVGPDTMIVPNESGSEIYVFDGKGRHLRTLDGLTLSELLRFTYDAHGYLTRVEDPDANALVIDRDAMEHGTAIHAPFGQTTTLAYDGVGHLAKATDALSRATSVTMDGGALLTQLVDANGGVHAMKYGPDGRLTQDSSPAGATWSMTRTEDRGAHVTIKTALGRTQTRDITFSGGGDETHSVLREDGTRTAWTVGQDGATRLVSADGTITEYLRVADPRFGMAASFVGAHTVTFPSGRAATWSAERTATMAADGITPTRLQTTTHDADGTWISVYDGGARTTTTTTPQGRTMRTGVDARGRLIDIEVPGLVPMALTYDVRGHIASATQGARSLGYVYDSTTGYPSEVHDAEGRVLKTVRDLAGRMTSAVRPDGAIISLGYDNDDNVVGVTPPGKPAHAMSFTKDDGLASYVAPGGSTTLYGYDLDQALSGITNPDGAKPAFTYDSAGRVSAFTYAGGSVQSVYSANTGLLSQLTGPLTSSLSYTYDGSLLMSTKAQGAAAGTVSWTYDGKLRVATETIGTSAIAFARDPDGPVIGAGQWSATRDPVTGRVASANVGGVNWTYTYTSFGEVQSLHVTTGAGPLLDLAYTYDKLSRIVTKTEADNAGAPIAWGYAYDLAGRLTTVTKGGATDSTYAYDANGNRTDNAAAVDDQDRLLSGFGATYTYTPNGDLATKTDGAGLTQYSYDGRGVLTGAALPASHSVSYGLDAAGRRISRTYDGAVTHRWVYRNGLQIGAEVDVSGAVVSRFVYGPMSQTPVYMERGGDVYTFVTDHLGSVRSVVRGSDGVVVQALTYDSWGKIASDSSPGFQPFAFAGGIYDAATSITRFGARDYDPSIGRWVSKDPTRFAGGLNLYGYAYGDPINYIDQTGRNPILVAIGIALLYGVFAPSDTAQAPADIGMMAAAASALPGLGVAGVAGALDVGLAETTVCAADRQAILRSLARGTSRGTRLVESEEDLGAIYEKLAQGGSSITPSGYGGTMVEFGDGARIGLRAGSSTGGATIDVFEGSGAYTKVHIR